MHVLVTGAGGFIGAALAERLQSVPLVPGLPLRLTLVDRVGPRVPSAPAVHWHIGGFADRAPFEVLEDHPPDCVFHLARVQGSVAGYGALGTQAVDERQGPQPTLSYGVHKWMTELLVADYGRRGDIDGCSLRLPGIVARPPTETGHGSAFMSQIFHALRARQMYTCPVSAQATAWWMSLQCCLDNLVHAARLPTRGMPTARCWQPPVLQSSVGDVVQAIAHAQGLDPKDWIRYAPDARTEALFGCLPALRTPQSEAAGFRHDGSLESLVTRVLGGLHSPGMVA